MTVHNASRQPRNRVHIVSDHEPARYGRRYHRCRNGRQPNRTRGCSVQLELAPAGLDAGQLPVVRIAVSVLSLLGR
jgi:hypothetical protein